MLKKIVAKIMAYASLGFDKNLKKYHKDGGDKAMRYNFDLSSSSLVFDLGGYKGQWSSDIYSRYRCKIFIFEPVKNFYDEIKKRFVKNEDIKPFPFGLSGKTEELNISLKADGSSVYREGEKKEIIKLVKFSNFIKEQKIEKVDLIKINIEGGEYDLLDEIINSDLMKNIKELQIQFHKVIPDAIERRRKIQDHLKETHDLVWNYDFIWEDWKLR